MSPGLPARVGRAGHLVRAVLRGAVLVGVLAGCASAPPAPPIPPPYELTDDQAYAPPAEPVGADDLFTLSPAMRAYLRSASFAALVHQRGPVRGLIDALYSKGELQLDYDASATRPAAATFDARAGNCLSLVIMTAAFAKALRLDITYQNVLVDQTWSRKGALYLASTHVNLTLARRAIDMVGAYDSNRLLTIDFLPPEDMMGYRSEPLDEDAIIAMYLNNRAAEALLADRVDDAYWWARAAVIGYPRFGNAYNTLGVVHERHGNPALAARALQAALVREPDNLVIMQNLVPVLRQIGRDAEADRLAARVAALQPEPPFFFFDKGLAAMEQGDFRAARDLFARETRRAPYYHEFHFWLAVASYRLGDNRAARTELQRALDTSPTREARNRYSAKLAHLRAEGGG